MDERLRALETKPGKRNMPDARQLSHLKKIQKAKAGDSGSGFVVDEGMSFSAEWRDP